MAWFTFTRDFDWRGPPRSARHCILCKWAVYAFKRRAEPIEIPDEAATEAEANGAGFRVEPNDEGLPPAPSSSVAEGNR